MFGNKSTTNELEKNFQIRMARLAELNKVASQEPDESPSPESKKTAQVRPEDFLVQPPEAVDVHGDDLDRKIEEVSSYAKDDCDDKPCDKCGNTHLALDGCQSKLANHSYLLDKKAQFVINELGKIAGDMRSQDKLFAADMIEATAIDIKNKTLKIAAEKLKVIQGLNKIAHNAYKNGDRITGDVVTVTIENIKKSS